MIVTGRRERPNVAPRSANPSTTNTSIGTSVVSGPKSMSPS
jgi:hypothetical protein